MMYLQGPAFSRILPFAVYILLLALNHPLSVLATSAGMDARWLYGIRVGMVTLLLTWFWRNYSELPWPSALTLQAWLSSIVAGVLVFVVWIAPYPEWAMLGSGAGFNPQRADGAGIDLLLAATRLTGAALIVPVMEELFWRSYLMRWLDRTDFLLANPAKTSWRAFVVTAALFAMEHSLWLAGLFAGLVYNWLYKRQRNLWAPVLAHAVTNGLLGLWVIQSGEWRYW